MSHSTDQGMLALYDKAKITLDVELKGLRSCPHPSVLSIILGLSDLQAHP